MLNSAENWKLPNPHIPNIIPHINSFHIGNEIFNKPYKNVTQISDILTESSQVQSFFPRNLQLKPFLFSISEVIENDSYEGHILHWACQKFWLRTSRTVRFEGYWLADLIFFLKVVYTRQVNTGRRVAREPRVKSFRSPTSEIHRIRSHTWNCPSHFCNHWVFWVWRLKNCLNEWENYFYS